MNLIEVNNVSKRFLLGSGSLKNLLLDRREADRAREFWALKDVSFAISQGTSLGIVGHNGSGKSTMLKLLTGILDPTEGSITTRGRIGALIEVGAGFHPDLTGRENVYLNGSILGMSEREITKRFDEIVDFAGLEQFIDTPVKRYSSGMYMRLGFSIAANINPDILIVDEVLAVGDTQFQNKCIRRMQEFIAQGGTVVFVSHAMGQVAQLCDLCVWLDHGQILYHGKTTDAVGRYMTLVREREQEEAERKYSGKAVIRREIVDEKLPKKFVTPNPGQSYLISVEVLDTEGVPQKLFQAGQPLRLRVAYQFSDHLCNPVIGLEFFRNDGTHMFTTSNYDHKISLADLPSSGTFTLDIPFLSLNNGKYQLRAALYPDGGQPGWNTLASHVLEPAAVFEVVAEGIAPGHTYLPVQWDKVGQRVPSDTFGAV